MSTHAKYQGAALHVFSTYLAGSSVSVLENHFVEIKEPMASSVSFYMEERPDTVIWMALSSVPTKKFSEVEKELIQILKKTADDPLNMDYLKDCLRRQKRKVLFYADLSGDHFSRQVITDFLFGETDGSTLKDLQTLRAFDELDKWSDGEWRAFLKRWISDAPHISILGKPSAKLAKKLKEDEVRLNKKKNQLRRVKANWSQKARIEARKQQLGEAGLQELAQKLEKAKAENDKTIPKEVIDQFKIPGVESIHFIPTVVCIP